MNRIIILREVVRKLTPMLAGMGVRVTQYGSQAYVETDPRTLKPKRVNIPHIGDDATEEFIQAIQGFIDHEIGHVLFTDWATVREANTRGAAKGKAKGYTEKFGADSLNNTANIVEDPFIERKMTERFKGSGYNLDRLHEVFLDKVTSKALVEASADPARVFSILVVPIVRAWSGQKIFRDYLDRNGYWDLPMVKQFVDQVSKDLIAEMPKLKSSWDTLRVAEVLWDIIYPPIPAEAPPPPGEGEGEESESDEPSESSESTDDSKKSSKSKSKSDKSEKSDDSDGKGSNKDKPEDEDDKGSGGEKSDEKQDQDERDGEDDADDDGGDAGEKGSSEEKDDEAEKDDGEGSSDDASDDEGDGDEADGESEGSEGSEEDDEPDEGNDDDGMADHDADEADGDDGDADSEDENGEGSEEETDDVGAGETDGDSDESGSSEGSEGGKDADGKKAAGGSGDGDSETEESKPEDDGKLEAAEAEGKGGGIGSSPFVGIEIDLSDKDVSGGIASMLTDEATRETREADYRVFTRDWDQIEKPAIAPHYEDSWLSVLDEDTRHMVGPMQKEIERMMAARSQVVNVPGFRSGRLHGGSLHRLQVNDDRVFRRRQENKSKDTVVTLLIDNSGSMGGGWRNPKGSKIYVAMAAGYALSQTLERVGVKHEVLGFTTGGLDKHQVELLDAEQSRIGISYSRTEPLVLPIYKGIDERLTPETKKRFANTSRGGIPLMNNVDGESLRVAAQRIALRPEARKVIIVLSDGHPACATYHTHEIYADMHRAVAECEKAKIDLVGLGIMSNAVKTFYPKHAVLDNLAELPKAVMGEIKRILLAA